MDVTKADRGLAGQPFVASRRFLLRRWMRAIFAEALDHGAVRGNGKGLQGAAGGGAGSRPEQLHCKVAQSLWLAEADRVLKPFAAAPVAAHVVVHVVAHGPGFQQGHPQTICKQLASWLSGWGSRNCLPLPFLFPGTRTP